MQKRNLISLLLLLLCWLSPAQVIFEPVGENAVWTTKEGSVFLSRMLEDMEAAQNTIEIEYYWFATDEAGQKVRDMLIRKVQEGVKVRLIIDNFTTPMAKESFYEKMRKAGVELYFVHDFSKMGPFTAVAHYFGERDHRKIVVIDGHIGYTGGMNFYQRALTEWMDTQLRLEGPAVEQLRALFEESWKLMGGGPVEPLHAAPAGEAVAQVVGSRGHEYLDKLYIDALRNAKEYFYLQTPYYAPPPEVVQAFKDAAARGVDVRLMVPEKSDWNFMNVVTQEYCIELYRAGLKVYVYGKAYDHTKVFISDDHYSSCSTVNMDYRSLHINWEDAVFFHDTATALHFKELFLKEAADAREIGPQDQPAKGLRKRQRNTLRELSPIL